MLTVRRLLTYIPCNADILLAKNCHVDSYTLEELAKDDGVLDCSVTAFCVDSEGYYVIDTDEQQEKSDFAKQEELKLKIIAKLLGIK